MRAATVPEGEISSRTSTRFSAGGRACSLPACMAIGRDRRPGRTLFHKADRHTRRQKPLAVHLYSARNG
eukprot:980653-Prymnesium_polylepis.1